MRDKDGSETKRMKIVKKKSTKEKNEKRKRRQ